MKVLLIDRNNFQRVMNVDKNLRERAVFPIRKLQMGFRNIDLMEMPLEERFTESCFVRRGTVNINGEDIPVLKEEY